MNYDWESKITRDVLDKVQATLPPGFTLRGIAVEEIDADQGALVRFGEPGQDVCNADIWGDIKADASRHYREAVEAAFYAVGEAEKGRME